jgi:hypothetical protein|uniref:Complex 1 LYR protein domain-containing protein n=1 Tax=Eutreptiella gymnastica TaxID=73025 RepID=A0A7S4FY21_9EUGL|mmetsp:Transcript_42419/g.71675  ORF Transcript_42419/g.71675 Transcript_42419/m.71675 type:complete len:132 (-) Transcript_42419:246-641(-)|eukprot:CAMPEP_0174284196 /NCGR_PEP_ID=MMETSP0809-20121228/4941_1 /TAXON_ID=73025 ORGANISM="Eutreptiella gymnastica-like, Strain CCMP1594" /NCGR_SAMPLE_ID=MMETSP0809 /ASSEMBLY_ACC=CAM_ASM_000658 /LENGTH=131 /DNA_ID=CAMNT_0015379569 /DNA_START=57 /DNA_END=452 /DNA_ORIENTATION=-
MSRTEVLGRYKSFMKLCYQMPKGEKASWIKRTREEFKANKDLTDPRRIQFALQNADKKLKELEASAVGMRAIGGKSRWVVRDGKLVEIGEEPPARGFFSRAADRFREGKLKHIESAYNATAKLPRTDLSGL